MAATAGSSCGEVGMKFLKKSFSSSSGNNWIQKLDRVNTNKFHDAQKFSMLIGSKLDRVNRPQEVDDQVGATKLSIKLSIKLKPKVVER